MLPCVCSFTGHIRALKVRKVGVIRELHESRLFLPYLNDFCDLLLNIRTAK